MVFQPPGSTVSSPDMVLVVPRPWDSHVASRCIMAKVKEKHDACPHYSSLLFPLPLLLHSLATHNDK
ncbi:hypothetical protein VTN96DRAFT_7411 [Rasamsonia emersonii]